MVFFRNHRIRALLCLLCMLALAVPFAGSAQEKVPKVVRVGWYESAFHHTSESGRRSGYGYEYQQRIAYYTGWTYEYVEGSWSELFEKLVAGDIDILSDVSYTDERAEKILYSAEAMGSEGYHLFISPTNTEIRPDDYSTLNGRKVGVNKNSIQEKLFVDWAKSHGVTPEIVESTEKTPVLLEMLANGDFDALVTLDTYGISADVVPVCKVGYAESYFGINKNRPDLKSEMDVAMNRLFEDNRDFNHELTDKLNPSGTVSSFLNTEEKKWLSGHPVIRVGYRDDFLPYSDYDEENHRITGALADYLAFAETCEKNARLSFETVPFKTTEDAITALGEGKVDCVFPVNYSAYDCEQAGLIITDPYVTTEMFAVVRNTDRQGISPDRKMTVAVLQKHPSHMTFLMDYFPNWTKMLPLNTPEECFRAVAEGWADCTLVSNYRINRVSALCAKYNLSTLSTGQDLDLCFVMKREDNCLFSILNKITNMMPDTMINSSLTGYGFPEDKVTFAEFLQDNLGYAIATVAIVAVIILLLVLRNMKVTEKAEEGREIISQAERDPLTGLYNRNFFHVYAARQRREHPDQPMDAVCMNIDRFHSVNALHGREFGDRALTELGGGIRKFLEETEGIGCRSEADRFYIYCRHREDWQAQMDRFQEVLDNLSGSTRIHLRMGVQPWKKDMDTVLQLDRARTACNKVRGDYKSQVVIYDTAMEQREERDQRLLNDMDRALENREFEVYYQPKYNIRPEEPALCSAEALVRWNHPDMGLIFPDVFVPLFERSGQISALDKYVWQEVARRMEDWRERFGRTLPVSVNLSRVDVFDPSLCDTLEGIVTEYGLSPADLNLEVTESAYTENADQLILVIERLRSRGFEIEMDDFGSGYSSLNMLSSMPIDVLKMDIAFIRNIERNERDFRLVELIVDIARYLKVPVVAEGVETENQLQLLKDAGCDMVQGYYFSRPLPPQEFEELLSGSMIGG